MAFRGQMVTARVALAMRFCYAACLGAVCVRHPFPQCSQEAIWTERQAGFQCRQRENPGG